MKKIIIATIILSFFVFSVKAQTKTALPSSEIVSPTIKVDEKEVKALKDKIATKVAQLRQKNNKAISGTITEIIDKIIKIKSQDDKEYEIKIDESLTKYYQVVGNQRKEVKIEEIKKGSYIIVMGLVNDKKVDANVIYLDDLYLVKAGKVTEVNKDDFSVKIVTSEKDNYTLDIETNTKRQLLNIKTLSLEPIGFSKIKEGDTIHFVVKKTGTEKETDRYSAQKILIIPQEYFLK